MVRIMPDQTTRGAACAANLCYRISHGQTAVKVSRGNTGMGLAGVCAQKGNPPLAATKGGAPITVQPAALWPSPNPSALQDKRPTETRLRGWAFRIRTNESVRELSDWNCVTTSPEGGASPAAETLRV
jgi:hypothetical protein